MSDNRLDNKTKIAMDKEKNKQHEKWVKSGCPKMFWNSKTQGIYRKLKKEETHG